MNFGRRANWEGAGQPEGSTFKHRYPMLSLANSYSWEDTLDFYRRVHQLAGKDADLVAELKFDGTSISIIYEGES